MRQFLTYLFAAAVLLTATKSNAQVNVTSSDSITCTNFCTNLTATFYGDVPINSGISIDDQYPDTPNPIGFNFNFYGNTYHSCLIGPNGTICFDTSLAGSFDDWTISAALAGNPTVYNSICGPWCDIDIVYGGTITYSTDGVAPNRRFVVTYCATHMFSCTAQYTTSQIILYETTNVAEVHIGHKTVCAGWNGGYAIVGVQNFDGSSSTAAPGRDFPSVWTATNEAWRFTPDTGYTTYTVAPIGYAPVPLASSAIYWYNETTGAYLGTGSVLGSGSSITVCPTTTTTYKAGALGCADTSFGFYTVVATGLVVSPVTYTNPTVCQLCDGTITMSGLIPGSSDTIHYLYNGVAQPPYVGIVSAGGTLTINGLCPGNYTNIMVTQGLCSSAPVNDTLRNPPITVSVVSTVNPSVCGYSDGSITLTGLYPSTVYNVTYDSATVPQPPLVQSSNSIGGMTISGLDAGTYNTIVTTGGPCPTTVAGPATLTDPPPPVVTVDSALVKTCVGIPVQLDAYATPTGITYYYAWTSPVGLSSTNISDPIVTPTFPGDVIYTVTVNPSPGIAHCASTATVDVHAVGDFVLNNHDTVICLTNYVQGSITGSPEISYLWTPSATVVPPTSTNPVITPTAAGTYVYTVTGSYAHCPDYVHMFTVEVDTPASAVTIRDTICLGMTDSFDFTSSSSAYYHYQWTVAPVGGVTFSNDTLPNPIVTPGSVGMYTLTVNVHPAAAGCGVNDFVYLDVLPNSISVSPTDTMVCKGAVVQAIGTGDPNFSYQWLPTTGIATSNVLNALISPDTTTDYVVVASFHRCPDMYAYLHLDVQPNPTVYIGGNRFICPYDTIHINSQVTPDWYPSYIYAWTPGTNLDNTNTPTVVFNGLTSTMLYLTVSTPAGCNSNDSAFVTVNAAPGTTIVPNMSFCPHDSAQLAPATSTASTFQWMPPFYLSDSTGAMPWIHPITTQTYTIVATTAMGCKDTTHFTATVLPAAVIFMPDSVIIYTGDSYNIEPTTNCVSFTWFPPAGLSSTIVSNPVATPALSTKYFVTGVTEDGCTTTDSIAILVEDGAIMAMPNAFTPGNGVNSLFKINLLGQAQLNYFRIFNRWGNLLYESTNINDGWDGNYKGQPQPFGVYIYEAQAVSESGKIYTKRGNITLLR